MATHTFQDMFGYGLGSDVSLHAVLEGVPRLHSITTNTVDDGCMGVCTDVEAILQS